MDFRKIARIFIIAFALLNIYLIVGIVERQDIQYTTSQLTEEDVYDNISESNIALPDLEGTDMESEEVYSLQINAEPLLENEIEANENHSGTLNDEGVYYVSFPSNPIELEGTPTDGFTEADFETVKEYVLSDQVMFGEEYTYSRYDISGRRFVFYQVVDGLPIADGTSELSLFVNENGDVISYQQTLAGPASRQGNPLQLINGGRAIEILFLNNEIRQGSEVQKPILTYRRALHLEDLSMYSPIWIVNVDHSSERNTYRVDAVNGTIIRQSTPSSGPQNPNDPAELTGEGEEEPEADEIGNSDAESE